MRSYLKILREERGLSQQNVADAIGISQQYYNMIENGERQQKMDVPLLKKLALVFKVSVEYILEQEDKVS